MKVLTKNPIVLDGKKVSSIDYFTNATGDVSVDLQYLPEEQVSYDDLNVKTIYPIVLNGTDVSPRDYYSNTNGSPKTPFDIFLAANLAAAMEQAKKTGQAPSTKDQEKAREKGLFWDNVKKNWQAFSQSEAGKLALSQIDAAITARRESKYGGGVGGALPSDQVVKDETKTEPMSTTTKVLLIGGGVLVVGLILYSVFLGKPTAATVK